MVFLAMLFCDCPYIFSELFCFNSWTNKVWLNGNYFFREKLLSTLSWRFIWFFLEKSTLLIAYHLRGTLIRSNRISDSAYKLNYLNVQSTSTFGAKSNLEQLRGDEVHPEFMRPSLFGPATTSMHHSGQIEEPLVNVIILEKSLGIHEKPIANGSDNHILQLAPRSDSLEMSGWCFNMESDRVQQQFWEFQAETSKCTHFMQNKFCLSHFPNACNWLNFNKLFPYVCEAATGRAVLSTVTMLEVAIGAISIWSFESTFLLHLIDHRDLISSGCKYFNLLENVQNVSSAFD